MEMLHPEGNIDKQWVENVSALLREMISSLTEAGAACRARVAAAGGALGRAGGAAGPAGAARDLLGHDTRPALHALQGLADGNNPAAVYLSREQAATACVEVLTSLPATVDERSARAALQAATALITDLPALAKELLELPSRWAAEPAGRRLTRQAAVTAPGRNNNQNRNVSGSRNAVGAGVWRRVRLKLEGRELDPHRRAPLADQVEYIIKEATSSENLCMMYEGWMAWV